MNITDRLERARLRKSPMLALARLHSRAVVQRRVRIRPVNMYRLRTYAPQQIRWFDPLRDAMAAFGAYGQHGNLMIHPWYDPPYPVVM